MTKTDPPSTTKVSLTVELPDSLLRPFLQHVRDFEALHFDETLIKMEVHALGMTNEQIVEIMESISPPFGTIRSVKTGT